MAINYFSIRPEVTMVSRFWNSVITWLPSSWDEIPGSAQSNGISGDCWNSIGRLEHGCAEGGAADFRAMCEMCCIPWYTGLNWYTGLYWYTGIPQCLVDLFGKILHLWIEGKIVFGTRSAWSRISGHLSLHSMLCMYALQNNGPETALSAANCSDWWKIFHGLF